MASVTDTKVYGSRKVSKILCACNVEYREETQNRHLILVTSCHVKKYLHQQINISTMRALKKMQAATSTQELLLLIVT